MADFGNPANALLGWDWEDIPGVPRVSTPKAIRHSGETLSNDPALLDRTAITKGALALAPLLSKIGTGGDFTGDALNPNEHWMSVAAFLKGSATPVEEETGAWRHRLSVLESAVNFPDTFSLYAIRSDDLAQRFLACRVSAIDITCEGNKLVDFKTSVATLAGDYWDLPAAVVGTGPLPILRGVSDLTFSTVADVAATVMVKVTAIASTTYTVKAKIGNATSYGSGTQVITKATWTQLLDEAGHLMGVAGAIRALPTEIWMPAGMAVNDEIRFERSRGEWVPAYVDASLACKEVSSRIYMDGVEAEIASCKISVKQDKVGTTTAVVGRRGPRRTQARGQQIVKISLNRDYIDASFRKRLELGQPFAFRADIGSDVSIGTSGNLDYRCSIICPNCVASGKTGTADKPDAITEALEATAGASDDSTYPSNVTFEFRNDIPDLLAA